MTRSSGVPWELLGASWDPLAHPTRLPEASWDRPGVPLGPILVATASKTPKSIPKDLQREAKWTPNHINMEPDYKKNGRSFPLIYRLPFNMLRRYSALLPMWHDSAPKLAAQLFGQFSPPLAYDSARRNARSD